MTARLRLRVSRVIVPVILLACATNAVAQTSLHGGEVAIVGLWSDQPKTFAFVTLVPLTENTVVRFTDRGWIAEQSAFRAGEGVVDYTVGAGGLAAGSVVTVSGESGGFNLSNTGDQIFAFQGSIDGNGVLTGELLWGVNDEGSSWQATANSSNTSGLPPSLTDYNVALAEQDNYAYVGPGSGTAGELQAAIGDAANWAGDDLSQPAFPGDFSIAEATVPALGIEGRMLAFLLLAVACALAGIRR